MKAKPETARAYRIVMGIIAGDLMGRIDCTDQEAVEAIQYVQAHMEEHGREADWRELLATNRERFEAIKAAAQLADL